MMSRRSWNPRLRNRKRIRRDEERGWDQAFIGTNVWIYNARDFLSDVNSRIPEFYEIVDILAFIRVIRKSRSARYCQSIQWHVYVRGSRWKTCLFFSFFFFLTVQLECCRHERITTWLRVWIMLFVTKIDNRGNRNWTWKLFEKKKRKGKREKRGGNLEKNEKIK